MNLYGLMRLDQTIMAVYPGLDFDDVQKKLENYNSVRKFTDQPITIVKIVPVTNEDDQSWSHWKK